MFKEREGSQKSIKAKFLESGVCHPGSVTAENPLALTKEPLLLTSEETFHCNITDRKHIVGK